MNDNEQVPKGGWKLGRDSFSKMICWFKDGNIRTMFSFDWRHRYSKRRDRLIGLERFRKKVSEYGSRAGIIEIYDNQSGAKIERYFEGNPVDPEQAEEVQFRGKKSMGNE